MLLVLLLAACDPKNGGAVPIPEGGGQVGVGVRTDGGGADVTGAVAVGTHLEIYGTGPAGTKVYGWAATGTDDPETLGSAVVGEDGKGVLPVLWAVDRADTQGFAVTDRPSAPSHSSSTGAWTCDPPHCAVVVLPKP